MSYHIKQFPPFFFLQKLYSFVLGERHVRNVFVLQVVDYVPVVVIIVPVHDWGNKFTVQASPVENKMKQKRVNSRQLFLIYNEKLDLLTGEAFLLLFPLSAFLPISVSNLVRYQ